MHPPIRREIILYGVFQNIDPPPPSPPWRVCTPSPSVRGEDTLAGWRGGWGWKTPDTALYSTYVSTLWSDPSERKEAFTLQEMAFLHCAKKPCFLKAFQIWEIWRWSGIFIETKTSTLYKFLTWATRSVVTRQGRYIWTFATLALLPWYLNRCH